MNLESTQLHAHTKNFGRGEALWQHIGQGPANMHFLAANGFPVGGYKHFLQMMAPHYSMLALENRGMWPEQPAPCHDFTWNDHAEDLIAFLDYQAAESYLQKPIIGVGHSIGATVTVLAAIKRPDLFSRLILIDPASLGPDSHHDKKDDPTSAASVNDLAERSLYRKAEWSNREEFLSYLASRAPYKTFLRQSLDDYAFAGLADIANGGVRLKYAPQWEAHNFRSTPSIWPYYSQLQMPCLILHGERSPIFSADYFTHEIQPHCTAITCIPIKNAGHLIPQEEPAQLIMHIMSWLLQC